MPVPQPRADGTLGSSLLNFEVVGTESLSLPGGFECSCTILEQRDDRGSVTRFWVSRDAPFVYRRHRDIGGQRDFVSDLVGFRPYS